MSNSKCTCLYEALLTTKDNYCKVEAKIKYKELIERAEKLPNDNKLKVTQLLNTAKTILGDLSLERIYNSSGIVHEEHECSSSQDTISIIKNLMMNNSNNEIEHEQLNNTTSPSSSNTAHGSEIDDLIQVEKVIDHRFRNSKLMLSILIKPGDIRINEEAEKVILKAQDKVAEYLQTLKLEHPRRLNHIIRLKPLIVKLFQ